MSHFTLKPIRKSSNHVHDSNDWEADPRGNSRRTVSDFGDRVNRIQCLIPIHSLQVSMLVYALKLPTTLLSCVNDILIFLSPQATHTAPEDARWRSRCNFSVLQHWTCATIIVQLYCMLHSIDGGKLASTLWLSWNGVSYMSTWGTDRVVSCGVPSKSFILGAGVVFAELVLFYDLSRIYFTLTAPFMIFVL